MADIKLRKYQEEGVKFILEKKKCIIAMDRGTGKTGTVLSAIERDAEIKKCSCVCGKKQKDTTWAKHLREWFDLDENDYQINSSKKDIIEDKKYSITTFDMAKAISLNDWDCIVVDEAHNLKNQKTDRFKVMKRMAKRKDVKYMILMTATPILNRPEELFQLLYLIKHPLAINTLTLPDGTKKEYSRRDWFMKKYCDGRMRKNPWTGNSFFDSSGAAKPEMLEELKELTKDVIYYVRWDEIPKEEQPPKLTVDHINITLSQEQEEKCKKAFDTYFKEVEESGEKSYHELKRIAQTHKLVSQLKEKQITSLIKIDKTFELVKKHISQGEKVVCFVEFRETRQILLNRLKSEKIAAILGNTEDDLKKFQNGQADVYITSVKQGGEGIQLQIANVFIISDPDYTPSRNEQAEARCWRIGQTKEVQGYYLHCINSVDDKVKELNEKKKQIISHAVERKTNNQSI